MTGSDSGGLKHQRLKPSINTHRRNLICTRHTSQPAWPRQEIGNAALWADLLTSRGEASSQSLLFSLCFGKRYSSSLMELYLRWSHLTCGECSLCQSSREFSRLRRGPAGQQYGSLLFDCRSFVYSGRLRRYLCKASSRSEKQIQACESLRIALMTTECVTIQAALCLIEGLTEKSPDQCISVWKFGLI